MATSKGTRGPTVVAPTNINCKAVLYFDIVVGFTSAEGIEKSQYRVNVFYPKINSRNQKCDETLTGAGNEEYRIQNADIDSAMSRPRMRTARGTRIQKFSTFSKSLSKLLTR